MTQLPEKSQTNTPPAMPAQVKEFEFDGYKFIDTNDTITRKITN
nr:MAG TPA: hypothetical protein [Bacteriophage sp.]